MKDKYKMNTDSTNDIPSINDNTNQNTTVLHAYNSFMAPPIGGIVRCTTCLDNSVQGKVVAYDQQTKMLVLRTVNPNKPNSYDVSFINVQWCSNLEVIEEPNDPPEMLLNLNIPKLSRRTRDNIDNKYKEINSLGNNVSTLAQHLYFTILKTLSEVEWNDKKIVVMNSVVIEPPYDANSCFSRKGENTQALEHVKKIVKKFHEDYKPNSQSDLQKTSPSSSQSDTPKTPSSPLTPSRV